MDCGCDTLTFERMYAAEVPLGTWPLSADQLPDTPIIPDLLEFCARAVGEPVKGPYHSFFRHHNLTWDRTRGLDRFVADVNLLFRRNGIAYEMAADGTIHRFLPQPLADALGFTLFASGDADTDRQLEAARIQISSPKIETRKDGLENLWDAFERLKTLEPGANKQQQADTLLNRAAPAGTKLREMLGAEAIALTNIGNTFRIRHFETSQEPLTTHEQIDCLFGRMFSFLRFVLKATGRGG